MKASFKNRHGVVSTPVLNGREVDTVIAALRFWQHNGVMLQCPERDIAENGRNGRRAALSADEIDALCERINK